MTPFHPRQNRSFFLCMLLIQGDGFIIVCERMVGFATATISYTNKGIAAQAELSLLAFVVYFFFIFYYTIFTF